MFSLATLTSHLTINLLKLFSTKSLREGKIANLCCQRVTVPCYSQNNVDCQPPMYMNSFTCNFYVVLHVYDKPLTDCSLRKLVHFDSLKSKCSQFSGNKINCLSQESVSVKKPTAGFKHINMEHRRQADVFITVHAQSICY